jgi:hypothetical protein
MIDLGIRQDDGFEWHVPNLRRRRGARESSELIVDIGRRVEQKPVLAVAAYRD